MSNKSGRWAIFLVFSEYLNFILLYLFLRNFEISIERLFSFYVYLASKYVWGGEKKEREFQKVSFRNDKALKHDIYL